MAGLGAATFFLLRAEETKLAETQYKSFAERAIVDANSVFQRRIMATVSVSSVISEMLPDADPWPYVSVRGFERLANDLIKTSSGVAMAFAPIIRGDEVEQFEAYAYDYFENSRKPPFPNGTAVHSFGKGIFGIDPSRGTSDGRYRVTNGITNYGSTYSLLTPLLHVSGGPGPFLMLNLHSDPTRGRAIDKMIDCSLQDKTNGSTENQNCAVITDTLILDNAPERGPAAVIMQPIYPSNDPTTLTGLVPNQIVWDELLENLFATEVSGIDCVIETKDQAFTYTIHDGIAKYRGEGNLHEQAYNSFERCATLTDENLYSGEGSPAYKLCLYPNKNLYKSYETNNPKMATIGTVGVIVFTSLLFFLYDFCVRRDVTAKKELLEAKRRFMRFVSHEVRTPLSAVSMGLNLIQSEIASSLGFQSCDDLDDFGGGNESTSLQTTDENVLAVSRKETLDWYGMTREIQSNTQSAVNVLNDFLNYDKIETGSLHLELTVLPMWRLIEQTTKEFKLAAERKRIKLDLGFGDDHVVNDEEMAQFHESLSLRAVRPNNTKSNKVIGDSVRLIQVLRNLISNAIKFTPEQGNVSIKIKYTNAPPPPPPKGKQQDDEDDQIRDSFVLKNEEKVSYPRSGKVEVSVRDSGPGMTEEQLKKLFNAGVQFNVNELQAGKGSGLGLYIAKGIVEQHDGTLIATSEGLGKGSTFTLTLPTHHIAERSSLYLHGFISPKNLGIDETEEEAFELEPESLRILVVDDAASIRKLLSRLLEKRGRLCDQAEDGKVAVEKVKDSMESGDTYDVVLLDYEMPEMNGPEAAKRIRALGSDVFIVGITGNLLPEDVRYFRLCGANAVLPKPLKIDDLEVLLVEHAVASQRLLGHAQMSSSLSEPF